jgi:acyl-CoA thioester hydrolase
MTSGAPFSGRNCDMLNPFTLYSLLSMDLSRLPITHKAIVLEEHLDEMGHMNVKWYTHFFDRGTWLFFESFGLGLAYFEGEDGGVFALEQHTRYLAEARLGQAITVRSRALGRSAKRLHFMHFMTLDVSGALSATTELVGIHVNRTTRRSSPLPDAITVAFDNLLAEHSHLDWEPPLCGVMGP